MRSITWSTRSWASSRRRRSDDETWGAKLTVMKENLEHHIEEEEGEMFKQAKQVFEPTELTQLGESMLKRKEELIKQQSATNAGSSR